jgi:hypothetical protein
MNTKRKISTAILLVFCILSSAEPITVNKARQTAVNFFSQHGKTLSSSTQPAKAPRRSTTAKDSAYYYVFNADSGSGYVIISGDDRTQQVLGYSDDGKFDEKNMSDNMKSWLQGYADEIKYIQDNNLKVTSSAKKISAIANSSTRHSVAPLMTCKWDQRAPYNQSCPMYTASDGNQYQSVTGCVATALAQVMYYYKYPKQIKTDLPYSWFDWSQFKTITFDKVPAGTTIDWDNMLDVTTSSNAAENRNAVSKLMLYVGQAIKTTYGAASSAYVNGTTVDALKTYFGYDDGTYSVSRSSYSENNWIDLIYKDIAAGRPVTMAGSSTGGRHCFVLDGFDGDEYFHLNWGWGGTNNGYYLVSALNPYDNTGAGAGTSTDGYSMDEVAFIGMQPANGIASDNEGTQMNVSNISVSGSKVSCNYANRTDYDLTFNMGIAYVANDGTLVPIGSPNTAKVNSGSSTTKSFTVSELAAGTYRIVPISKVSTGSDWRTMLDINNEYIKAVVSTSGSVTLTYIKNSSALSVSNIEIVGNKTKGYKQEVQVTLNNKGSEYYGYIYLIVASDSLSKNISTYTQLSVGNDRSVTKSLTFTPSTSGKYTIYIATSNSTSSPLAKQAVNISTDGATTLSLTGTTIDNALSGTAYGNFIKGKMALKNTGTNDFNGKIQVVLWENKTGSGTFYSSTKLTKDISVAAGETTYTDFLFDDLEVGQKYAFGVAYTDRSGYINKIGSTYSLSSGLLEYKKDGSINICRTIFNITTHDDVVALDLRSDSKIRTLKPNNNPNTLYFLPEGATAPATLNGKNVIYGTKTDSININIDSAFFNPIKFTVSKIKISKTFSNPQKRWVSIIFPFIPSVVTIGGKTITWFQNKTSSTKGIKMKEFKYLSINDEVGLDDVETLQTNTPYLMSSIDKGGNNLYGSTVSFSASNTEVGITNQSDIIVGSDAFNYYGTTVGIAQDNAYVLNNEGTAFIPKTNVSIEPFGSYFTCKLVASKRPTKIIVEDVVTDINNIGISEGNAKLQVYSLNGMKVAEAYVSNGHISLPDLPKGIYIVGGKKIAVK